GNHTEPARQIGVELAQAAHHHGVTWQLSS
ncbi:MAG: hypothetical protein ACI9YR_001847, partial [Bacteroidia bacterium]